MKWRIALVILLIVGCFIAFNLSRGQECLSYREIPEKYFENHFYAVFDTNIEEQEIVKLINESGLSTTNLHIDGDIYYILSDDYSANYSAKLENLFNPIPKIKSIIKRHNRFIGVEFYKNVSPSGSKKIVEEVVETNGVLVSNNNYSDIGLERRSSAYIDIPQDSEFNVIEWVCKFRENEIVKDARLQSSVIGIASE